MSEPNAAVKLCECGCGEPTKIAKWNDLRHGHVKGQGVRFLKGHHNRGKPISAEHRAAIVAANSGPGAPSWRGDDASYRALHGWLCKHYPKTGICEECGKKASRTHYAIIHGRQYSRNRADYRELCVPCHMRYDLGGRAFSPEALANIRTGIQGRWDEDKKAGRGRYAIRGEDVHCAKLTEAIVREARRRHAEGVTYEALGHEYGVSRYAIRNAVRGKTWAHVK